MNSGKAMLAVTAALVTIAIVIMGALILREPAQDPELAAARQELKDLKEQEIRYRAGQFDWKEMQGEPKEFLAQKTEHHNERVRRLRALIKEKGWDQPDAYGRPLLSAKNLILFEAVRD